jgi:serine/threonine protein kinase
MGYKSPEQLTGIKLDARTDLFNVGLIAYLAFSAIHPFTDERFLFTHREMVLEPYRTKPPITRNTVPPDLGAFVLRLLECEPTKRFDSATQALSEFENVETAFRDLLQDRCLRLHDALVSGAAPEAIDSNDLATGISLLKQSGFYAQAKLLYEKGGLDLSQLSPAARSRVNEDYAFCGRRLEKEETFV